jgi:hypothetical protein
MDYLNKLGAAKSTSFGVLETLTVGEKYLIQHWTSTLTRFGRQVTIFCNDQQYFLPSRFNVITEEEINSYNNRQMCMIYKGHKKFGNYPPTAILEFIDA